MATPDHVIRTKAYPLLINPLSTNGLITEEDINFWKTNLDKDLKIYIDEYKIISTQIIQEWEV